ncbi:two-component system, response regulator YesN [Anaerocolumna jejuensis DSM 15929]|uniref:Stage 0 sporulation protein A homolog n=1 Tax=Anaerocolumna jejuensis DSM 15929 TaxID=1121322 RepID=A0A1M6JEE4_9FIRM|nr:response regulator [Anaerocolumna jejuensis]SHJ45014.1 two-component system, response regulator YesN [Anaerocolumna jejuensis DSM 15929]
MFKVIVVDDEPSALDHICTIIKNKNPEYEVIGTADNGLEALEMTRSLEPDLVISDVRMPLMDGIKLVSEIKNELPEIFTIIVSGYQDFEYAKGAIQSGTYDYILKPILPSNMKMVLEKLAIILRKNYFLERKLIIHKLVNGKSCEENKIQKYFPYKEYYCAIIRKNGLLRRFAADSNVEIYPESHEIMTIYGRDEMESLYILPKELLVGKTFEEYITGVKEKGKTNNQYITLIYGNHSFPVSKLQEKVKELYRTLDTVSVVGLNQVLNIDNPFLLKEIEFNSSAIKKVLENLECLVKEQQYDKFKKELKRLYQKWLEEKKPQLWTEHISHQIIYIVNKYNKEAFSLIECEYMLEDTFFYAETIEELVDNLLEIIFKYVRNSEEYYKVDTIEFFNSILLYLENHLSEDLSLQVICKKFTVSQTYLSRMFRKYTSESFNQYLISMRMNKAIEIMQNDSEKYIKDVAAMVGYYDQFYFSRVFRSYTGKCPTDYLVGISLQG